MEVDGGAGGGEGGGLGAEEGELAVQQVGGRAAVGAQDPPPGDVGGLAVAEEDLADVAGGGVALGQGGHVAVGQHPAGRVQALCRIVADEYGGDAAALWRTAGSGRELLARLRALPGFGEQKARIFVALLGKQLGVQPDGWREVAGPYGEDGSRRSAADVTDAETLAEVRAFKQAAKRAAKGGP